jgi:predicted ATPase with chaperone activity
MGGRRQRKGHLGTLAHNGVLFPEDRSENSPISYALRQPLEDREDVEDWARQTGRL